MYKIFLYHEGEWQYLTHTDDWFFIRELEVAYAEVGLEIDWLGW